MYIFLYTGLILISHVNKIMTPGTLYKLPENMFSMKLVLSLLNILNYL